MITRAEINKICGDLKNNNDLTIQESIDGFEHWFDLASKRNTEIEENLGGMHTNGLSEDEAFFILCWTGTYSYWINPDLRQGKILSCACKRAFVYGLDLALQKVECFNNQIVYRSDNPDKPKEVMDWFAKNIGNSIRLPYYLSTSLDNFNNSPIVWRIKTLQYNSTGKNISRITSNKFEKEILFTRNSVFKIVGIDKTNYVILLEEKGNSELNPIELVGAYYEE